MYSESQQFLLDGSAQGQKEQLFKYGLVKGRYSIDSNEADVHVETRSKALPSLEASSMLAAAKDLYQAMNANYLRRGVEGKVLMNPQGAAVIKRVVEVLSESLGGTWGTFLARLQKERRKFFEPEFDKNSEVFAKEVVPEHLASLEALKGKELIITTVLSNQKNVTEAEIKQSIVEDSPAGRERRKQYEEWLQNNRVVSLSIEVPAKHLSAAINKLQQLVDERIA